MSWWSEIPLFLMTTAIFLIPGLFVALMSGTRGFALLVFAPAITVTVVSVGAIVAPWVGLGWIAGATLTTLVAGVVALVIRWWTRPRQDPGRRGRVAHNWMYTAALVGAVLVASILIGRRLLFVFGAPDSFSQTFDNVFHLNAVRYILETGGASTFQVGQMAGNSYYPAAWHDMVALVGELTQASIPVAVNAVNFFASAVLWPIACIYLAQQLFGRRPVVVMLSGVLAAAFGSFPLLMLDHGVLNPNVLSIALLPIALGAAVGALGLTAANGMSRPTQWLLFLAVVPGMSLAHPSTTMAMLALLIPAAFAVATKMSRSGGNQGNRLTTILPWVGVFVYVAAVALLWAVVRPVEAASTWVPIQSTGQAIGEAFTGTALGRPVTWAVFVLTVIGVAALVVQPGTRWIGCMYLVVVGFYVVVSSFPQEALRMFITGVWYNDSPRLAALIPTMAVPVAAYGGTKLLEWLSSHRLAALWLARVESKSVGSHGYVALALAGSVALMGVTAYLTQKGSVRQAAEAAKAAYEITPEAMLISTDEMLLLERLDDEVPEDSVLAGNPWTGTSLAYALADRKTLQLHILANYDDDVDTVYNRLRDADTDPEVCAAVDSTNVDYILDFGTREVHGADHGYVGLRGLEEAGVAELVDQQGEAKLFEITACK